MSFADEADALAQLEPGVDGVIFEYGSHRSTFLPQVWEDLPDPRISSAHLKHKAGLPPDFWDPAVKLVALHGDEVERTDPRMSDHRSERRHPGRWWHLLDDGRMQCDLCPRDCRLHEGQRGACFVRQRDRRARWC